VRQAGKAEIADSTWSFFLPVCKNANMRIVTLPSARKGRGGRSLKLGRGWINPFSATYHYTEAALNRACCKTDKASRHESWRVNLKLTLQFVTLLGRAPNIGCKRYKEDGLPRQSCRGRSPTSFHGHWCHSQATTGLVGDLPIQTHHTVSTHI
jgi:hypothetical protein